MSNDPLEAEQAASYELARKLFDQVGNWEPVSGIDLLRRWLT
jgi:hypothetical protein